MFGSTIELDWEPDVDNGFWGTFEIFFEAEPFTRATHWNPPEGGEFYIRHVKLLAITAIFVHGIEIDAIPPISDEVQKAFSAAFLAAIDNDKDFQERIETRCLESITSEEDYRADLNDDV